MSRSGCIDGDDDTWAIIRWSGAVKSSIRGKRGQEFLRSLADALDAMDVKELTKGHLQDDGCMCTLGVACASRGVDIGSIDDYDRERIASSLGIAEAMAAEVMWLNDECGYFNETKAQRWIRMRNWVAEMITAQGEKA